MTLDNCIIKLQEIKIHRDDYRGDWVATPIGVFFQAPRYGMYKFAAEGNKDIVHYNIERLMDSVKDRFGIYYGESVKDIIKQNVQNIS